MFGHDADYVRIITLGSTAPKQYLETARAAELREPGRS
jgi:hypothetical protein